jgi:isopenicillin N synthase-like dioxygenase
MNWPRWRRDDDDAALLGALATQGAVVVELAPSTAAAAAAALAVVPAFFAEPAATKCEVGIEGSRHHRGYSVMQNERDHREQLHLGRDRPAVPGAVGGARLQGGNRWPATAGFRPAVERWFDLAEALGWRCVTAVATRFGAAAAAWRGDDPNTLLKCIGYHPQLDGRSPRRGVAAHVDFSHVTLTLQDDVGGLELQRPDGVWAAVPPRPGTLLLHAGELLQYVTGGALQATPHRVVNPSPARARVSLPLFVNPSLDVVLRPPPTAGRVTVVTAATDGPAGHVHRVLPDGPPPSLSFGAAEWQRKGENRWCARCCG